MIQYVSGCVGLRGQNNARLTTVHEPESRNKRDVELEVEKPDLHEGCNSQTCNLEDRIFFLLI